MHKQQMVDQLNDLFDEGIYINVELNNHPYDTQYEGFFVSVDEDGLVLERFGGEGEIINIVLGDINCIMDEDAYIMWPIGGG